MEKNRFFVNVVLCNLILLCVIAVCTGLSGCASTANTSVDATILEYQGEIARLENTVASYQREIGYAVEELGNIRDRTTGMEGTIDEVIDLFEDYQQRVERVLQRYRELQAHFGRENCSADVAGDIYGD